MAPCKKQPNQASLYTILTTKINYTIHTICTKYSQHFESIFFHLYNVSYAHGNNNKNKRAKLHIIQLFAKYLNKFLLRDLHTLYNFDHFAQYLHSISLRFISGDLQFTTLATLHNSYTFFKVSLICPQYMASCMNFFFATFYNIYTTYCSCFFYTLFGQYNSQLSFKGSTIVVQCALGTCLHISQALSIFSL